MCIRDRRYLLKSEVDRIADTNRAEVVNGLLLIADKLYKRCLLYTSDAADERSSVDLGGRRIIQNKTPSSQSASNIIILQHT